MVSYCQPLATNLLCKKTIYSEVWKNGTKLIITTKNCFLFFVLVNFVSVALLLSVTIPRYFRLLYVFPKLFYLFVMFFSFPISTVMIEGREEMLTLYIGVDITSNDL